MQDSSGEARQAFHRDLNNWQPRIGFAYAVTPKLAVRGGYGLFYQLSRSSSPA